MAKKNTAYYWSRGKVPSAGRAWLHSAGGMPLNALHNLQSLASMGEEEAIALATGQAIVLWEMLSVMPPAMQSYLLSRAAHAFTVILSDMVQESTPGGDRAMERDMALAQSAHAMQRAIDADGGAMQLQGMAMAAYAAAFARTRDVEVDEEYMTRWMLTEEAWQALEGELEPLPAADELDLDGT